MRLGFAQPPARGVLVQGVAGSGTKCGKVWYKGAQGLVQGVKGQTAVIIGKAGAIGDQNGTTLGHIRLKWCHSGSKKGHRASYWGHSWTN